MQPPEAPPPTLRELQQLLADAILHPGTLAPNAGIGALVRPTDPEEVITRLRVYTNGYPARVQEALEETFPAVAHIVSHGAFTALAERYTTQVPLSSYNLNDAGEVLPDFLRRDALTDKLPFLPDLARLEWSVARAFHAAHRPPLDPTALASWTLDDWARAVLQFQPSVAVLRSPWPIRELWECRETPIHDIDVDLHDRPDQVLVCRVELSVHCESISAAEAQALGMLLDGRPLGALNEVLSEGDAAAVSTWFARWMQLGMIANCALAA